MSDFGVSGNFFHRFFSKELIGGTRLIVICRQCGLQGEAEVAKFLPQEDVAEVARELARKHALKEIEKDREEEEASCYD